jgi:hypothetical protein
MVAKSLQVLRFMCGSGWILPGNFLSVNKRPRGTLAKIARSTACRADLRRGPRADQQNDRRSELFLARATSGSQLSEFAPAFLLSRNFIARLIQPQRYCSGCFKEALRRWW